MRDDSVAERAVEVARRDEPDLGSVPSHHQSAFGPSARRLEERVRALQDARRKARRDLRVLLRVPPAERSDKIFSARSRYRSRAFAELLVEESRHRAKDDPRQARELAALIPEIARWIPGADVRPWRLGLEVMGRALEANALRVSGDLPAADRAFSELRHDLSRVDFDDPRAAGEAASLEASLRIDQRRFREAGRLLDRAAHCFRRAGSRRGFARALIKRANLARHEHDYAAAEGHLRDAAELLDRSRDAALYAHTIGARAACLCDLGRFDEVEAILDSQEEMLAAEGSRWGRLLVLDLRGRIALSRGDHATAEAAFLRVHEGALELGRGLDAALAAVDLALVYLDQSRVEELRDLAAGLLLAFKSLGVPRETLAALRLFHQAATAPEIDAARLRQVRRLLHRSVPQHA